MSEAGRRIWNGNWEARWDASSDVQTLTAMADDIRFALRLSPLTPPVIQGENGVSVKGAGVGQASHYVSFPRLAVEGKLNGASVTGTAWMDHEWFSHQLAPDQRGWDWFSVQLDNGTELMLFQLRRMDGTIDPYSSGTYIAKDGRSTHLKRARLSARAASLVDQSEDRRQISDALADPRPVARHRAGVRRRGRRAGAGGRGRNRPQLLGRRGCIHRHSHRRGLSGDDRLRQADALIIVRMSISEGKLRRMKALSNQRGIIAAAAMDQRGSLQKSLAVARGVDMKEITPEMMSEFKVVVTQVLTPHASAILLDPEFGLDAARARSKNAGLLLAYELSGYDNTQPGRLPDLLPHVSVKRIVDWGADAVKILIYYTPSTTPRVNDIKHAFIERIGAECETYQIPFFLEFVGYDPKGGDEKGLEFAKIKPEIVKRSMEEFSKPQYNVDVLKVEVPINAEYVEGSSVYKGQKAYSRDEALKHFREAAAIATKPFIYLSAGVSNAQFTESLNMATEAGTDYSGVLCGRATWKEGIPVYAKQGAKALEDWLQREGVKNINAVNEAIKSATPWYAKMGVPANA